ncbi:hypothetical protein pb186bvf_003383 [Paramecium bursaria]
MSWLGSEDYVPRLNRYEKYLYSFGFSYLTISSITYGLFFLAKDQIIKKTQQSIELKEEVSIALNNIYGRRAQSYALYKHFSGPFRFALILPLTYVAARSMINHPEDWDLPKNE